MVRGLRMAVTAVALMYQCAETTRIARGRGTASRNARHAGVWRLWSRAFKGLPWPRKAAGIRVVVGTRGDCALRWRPPSPVQLLEDHVADGGQLVQLPLVEGVDDERAHGLDVARGGRGQLGEPLVGHPGQRGAPVVGARLPAQPPPP